MSVEVDPNASDVPPETDGDVDDDDLGMDELENDSEDEDLAGEARLRRYDEWGNCPEEEEDSENELVDQLMEGEGGSDEEDALEPNDDDGHDMGSPQGTPPTPGDDNQDGEGGTEAGSHMEATGGGGAAELPRYHTSKIAEEMVRKFKNDPARVVQFDRGAFQAKYNLLKGWGKDHRGGDAGTKKFTEELCRQFGIEMPTAPTHTTKKINGFIDALPFVFAKFFEVDHEGWPPRAPWGNVESAQRPRGRRRNNTDPARPPKPSPLQREWQDAVINKQPRLFEGGEARRIMPSEGNIRHSGRHITTEPMEMVQYFKLLFTDSMLQEVLDNTNAYTKEWEAIALRQRTEANPRPVPAFATRPNSNRSMRDLHKFIGVVIGLGAGGHNRHSIKKLLTRSGPLSMFMYQGWLHGHGVTEQWYWDWTMSIHFQHDDFFKHVRTIDPPNRHKHLEIVSGECNGNGSWQAHNHRCPKIGRLLEQLRLNCMKHYQLGQDISLDENVTPLNNRATPLGMRNLLPHKPNNGILSYCLCCASTGYVWNFLVDSKEDFGSNTDGKIAYFVLVLCAALKQKWHRVWMDNLFVKTSVLEKLFEWNIYAAGTCRSPCKSGFPDDLTTDESKNWEKGKMQYMFAPMKSNPEHGVLTAVVWKDSRPVKFLASFYMDGSEMISRRQRGSTAQQYPAPMLLKLYNKYMGGVDQADHIMQKNNCQRRSRKWHHSLFYQAINITLHNAYVLYQKDYDAASEEFRAQNRKLDRANFMSSVARSFLGTPEAEINMSSTSGPILQRVPPPRITRRGCKEGDLLCEHVAEINCQRPRMARSAKNERGQTVRRRCQYQLKVHGEQVKTIYFCEGCGVYLMPECFVAWHWPDRAVRLVNCPEEEA